jgi:hypothetical protein
MRVGGKKDMAKRKYEKNEGENKKFIGRRFGLARTRGTISTMIMYR